jgi:hypothetical protein
MSQVKSRPRTRNRTKHAEEELKKRREEQYSEVVRDFVDRYLRQFEKLAEKRDIGEWDRHIFDFWGLGEKFAQALGKISEHYEYVDQYILLPTRKPVSIYKVLKVTMWDELMEILEMYYGEESKGNLNAMAKNEIEKLAWFVSAGF